MESFELAARMLGQDPWGIWGVGLAPLAGGLRLDREGTEEGKKGERGGYLKGDPFAYKRGLGPLSNNYSYDQAPQDARGVMRRLFRCESILLLST